MILRISLMFGLAFWLVACDHLLAFTIKDTCVTERDLRICVQARGPCKIDHLIGHEKAKLSMEMFHVSIINRSAKKIKILPENFYGITEQGYVVVLDPPFYESIELKTKLKRHDLSPNEEMKGFVLLPSSMGRIRAIVYGGNPTLEIQLY